MDGLKKFYRSFLLSKMKVRSGSNDFDTIVTFMLRLRTFNERFEAGSIECMTIQRYIKLNYPGILELLIGLRNASSACEGITGAFEGKTGLIIECDSCSDGCVPGRCT